MWIHLRKPYKIIPIKEKSYSEHYNIPASRCVVVPLRTREEEMLCDVHWEDSEGMRSVQNLMFLSENLEPLSSVGHAELYELWGVIGKSLGYKTVIEDPQP